MASSLVTLFDEAWPTTTFPQGCSVTDAREMDQRDLADVVDIATSVGARGDFIRRLRDEHPTDRQHHPQHDDRLWDVMVEAMALAWVSSQGLGRPRFCLKPGHPDLEVAGRVWIEVKSVHESDRERAETDELLQSGNGKFIRTARISTDVPEPLLNKLQRAADNAISKFDRVDPAAKWQHIVWIQVRGIDFGTSLTHAWQEIERWAHAQRSRNAADLVLVDGWNWSAPKLGLPGNSVR